MSFWTFGKGNRRPACVGLWAHWSGWVNRLCRETSLHTAETAMPPSFAAQSPIQYGYLYHWSICGVSCCLKIGCAQFFAPYSLGGTNLSDLEINPEFMFWEQRKRGTSSVPLPTTTKQFVILGLNLAAAGDEEENQATECHQGVGGRFGNSGKGVHSQRYVPRIIDF
jgi:hypothetical protein